MSAIPEGFTTVTPYLTVKNAAATIDLYIKALGAEEIVRMPMPGSDKIMHACIQVGSSKVFLCDENPDQGMTAPDQGPTFYLYYEDVDAQHQQAVAAGMSEISPPTDMFWGDRMSVLIDEFGQTWNLASHTRDVSEEEMQQAMAQMA